jgi:FO synthase subunit 1
VEVSCGQGIAEHDSILDACRYYGLNTFLDYLEMVHRCMEQMATSRRSPLIPIWDLGPLSLGEMRRLRPSLLSLKLSLESLDPSLRGQPVFRESPAKAARWGIQVLENAGRARIPVTAVTLVGIGEKPGFVEATLVTLAELHRAYGNLQSVCVRGFKPEPGTVMGEQPAVEKSALLAGVSAARRILPPEVAVQVRAADFPEWAMDLVEAGADDLGEIPLQGTPEALEAVEAWETQLGVALARKGIRLRYRLPIYETALKKGLYPVALESRLNSALSVLRNGASPKHPDPPSDAGGNRETPAKHRPRAKGHRARRTSSS